MTINGDDERTTLLAELETLWLDMESVVAANVLKPLMSIELTMQQMRVVALLVTSPDGCTVKELAETFDVSLATMSGIVDRLETHQVVGRVLDPTDHRVRRVLVTDAGRKQLQELISTRRHIDPEALSAIALPDLRALMQGMSALLAVMRAS